MLRVPWNLKLFLSLPAPRPLLDSFYDLARKIWDKAIKDADDPQRCGDLVDLIAERIDEDENFTVPESITDGHVKERMRLLSENILRRPAQSSLIGFRHQTFYDYFLMRIFERKATDTRSVHRQAQGELFHPANRHEDSRVPACDQPCDLSRYASRYPSGTDTALLSRGGKGFNRTTRMSRKMEPQSRQRRLR